jgi:hypothetical protein
MRHIGMTVETVERPGVGDVAVIGLRERDAE